MSDWFLLLLYIKQLLDSTLSPRESCGGIGEFFFGAGNLVLVMITSKQLTVAISISE
jgi:hypothetical protein